MTDIKTWADVLAWLRTLTPEQLAQTAEVYANDPTSEEPRRLDHVVAGGTVEEFFGDDGATRSSADNTHDPARCVLLLDDNPFSPVGDLFYDLREDGGLVGNVTGGSPDDEGTAHLATDSLRKERLYREAKRRLRDEEGT